MNMISQRSDSVGYRAYIMRNGKELAFLEDYDSQELEVLIYQEMMTIDPFHWSSLRDQSVRVIYVS